MGTTCWRGLEGTDESTSDLGTNLVRGSGARRVFLVEQVQVRVADARGHDLLLDEPGKGNALQFRRACRSVALRSRGLDRRVTLAGHFRARGLDEPALSVRRAFRNLRIAPAVHRFGHALLGALIVGDVRVGRRVEDVRPVDHRGRHPFVIQVEPVVAFRQSAFPDLVQGIRLGFVGQTVNERDVRHGVSFWKAVGAAEGWRTKLCSLRIGFPGHTCSAVYARPLGEAIRSGISYETS